MNTQLTLALNSAADAWAAWMWPMAWHVTVLVLVVAALTWLLRGRSARLRYALWLLVPIRLLLPPTLALATGWGWWLLPSAEVTNAAVAISSASDTAVASRGGAETESAALNSLEPEAFDRPEPMAGATAVPRVSNSMAAESLRPAATIAVSPRGWLFCGWLLGVGALTVRLLFGCLGAAKMVRRAQDISLANGGRRCEEAESGHNKAAGELLESCRRRMGIRRQVRLRQLADAGVPMLIGLVRPTIILPTGLDKRLTSRELEAVLVHELQHVARHDAIVHFVQSLLGVLYFFHPLVWLTNRVLSGLREDACDEATVAVLEGQRRDYGAGIVKVAELMSGPTPSMSLGIVESGGQVKRRLRRILDPRLPVGRRLSWSGLALLLLLAAVVLPAAARPGDNPTVSGPVPRPTELALATDDEKPADGKKEPAAQSPSEQKPAAPIDFSGTVQDTDGQPIVGAKLHIYSACLRTAIMPDWPTSDADHGKGAATDNDGHFSISGLDPALVFRLLVAADGYEPKVIDRFDPQAPDPTDFRLAKRSLPDDPQRIVRGVVIDPSGKPAARAFIKPYGIKNSERRWRTSFLEGADCLAITDQEGRFVIVCGKPVEGLDLHVAADGAARTNFELAPPGEKENRLVLKSGVTVAGRAVQSGRGVAGITVSIKNSEGEMKNWYIGTYTAITDADGRFSVEHLPEAEAFTVYGAIDSLRDLGAIAAKNFKTADSGVTQVGDLPIVAGHRVAGRLAMEDGKAIPPGTRVTINCQASNDWTTVPVDAEGRFNAKSIPDGLVQLSVLIEGFHISPKNGSFHPINRGTLHGLVNRDIDDLIVLIEPGKSQYPDWNSPKMREWQAKLQYQTTQPLVGVTADLAAPPEPYAVTAALGLPSQVPPPPLPKIDIPPARPAPPSADATPARIIAGTVIDAEDKPVAAAQVWFLVSWSGAADDDLLAAAARSGADGRFALSVPEAWLLAEKPMETRAKVAVVWAFAPGHAISNRNVWRQPADDKAAEPLVIKLPPASDISFVVTTPDGQPAAGAKIQPLGLMATRNSQPALRPMLDALMATTDAEGRAGLMLQPDNQRYNLLVSFADYGQQFFHVDEPTAAQPPKLELRATGRIEGRIVGNQPALFRGMTVQVTSVLPEGKRGPNAAVGTADVPVDDEGRFVIPHIAAGQLARLEVTQDQRLPVRPRLPKLGTLAVAEGETLRLDIPLEMCVRVHGIVRAKDSGSPLAGMPVVVSYGAERQIDRTVTDADGAYSAFALPGDVSVRVNLPADRAQFRASNREGGKTVPFGTQDFEWPPIEIESARTVTGKLLDIDGQPLAGVTIQNQTGREILVDRTDKEGAFSLDHVPADQKLEEFNIFKGPGGGQRTKGKAVSTDPLVVREQP